MNINDVVKLLLKKDFRLTADNAPSVSRYQYPELKVNGTLDTVDAFLMALGIQDLPVYEAGHDYYLWIELVEKRRTE